LRKNIFCNSILYNSNFWGNKFLGEYYMWTPIFKIAYHEPHKSWAYLSWWEVLMYNPTIEIQVFLDSNLVVYLFLFTMPLLLCWSKKLIHKPSSSYVGQKFYSWSHDQKFSVDIYISWILVVKRNKRQVNQYKSKDNILKLCHCVHQSIIELNESSKAPSTVITAIQLCSFLEGQ
jgi:hypothetical protein